MGFMVVKRELEFPKYRIVAFLSDHHLRIGKRIKTANTCALSLFHISVYDTQYQFTRHNVFLLLFSHSSIHSTPAKVIHNARSFLFMHHTYKRHKFSSVQSSF